MIKDSTMINNGDNEDIDESDEDLVNGGGRGGDGEPSSKSSLPGGCLTETRLQMTMMTIMMMMMIMVTMMMMVMMMMIMMMMVWADVAPFTTDPFTTGPFTTRLVVKGSVIIIIINSSS